MKFQICTWGYLRYYSRHLPQISLLISLAAHYVCCNRASHIPTAQPLVDAKAGLAFNLKPQAELVPHIMWQDG